MSEEHIEIVEETIVEDTQQEQTQQSNKKSKKSKDNVDKNKKLVRNVSVKQCVATIIFSLVVCLLTFIPYTFGNAGLNFTFKFLPLIGNGEIMNTPELITNGLVSLLSLDASVMDILTIGLNYYVVVFYGIVLFDILAAIVLIIFRNNVLRIIFKVISIIAGIVMLLIAVLGIVYILGLVGGIASGTIQLDNVISHLENTGILFILILIIFACFMSIKQFRWFGKRW